jgi:hypothetical protein
MMLAAATPSGSGRAVRLEDLQIGELLAEGGEGRVFELPLQPHLVVKQYRRPAARDILDDIVSWPDRITDPALAQRVRAATAWPAASVLDATAHDPDQAGGAGVLLPRAPRRFALRHRDGTTRLATLSYLTADPAHRAVAYGLSLPEPVSAARLGLIYALARVLEAFDTGSLVVGHGDLSTKNVLWSLQRGPEVFIIDCDNCEHFGPDGRPLTPAGRRRAMTPNWDDPAVAAGHNPTLASDRYSLALIFLRVVGAANFPIQARQRQGGPITVDFAVPSGHFHDALLGPGAHLWDLCERGLTVSDPACRPPASAWLAPLEAVLDALGASSLMRSVWAAQGGGTPSAPLDLEPVPSPRDVIIRPVPARPRPLPRRTLADSPALAPPWRRAQPAGAGAGVPAFGPTGAAAVAAGGAAAAGLATLSGGAGGSSAGGSWPGPAAPPSDPPVTAQARAYLSQAGAWWAALHRHMLRALWTSGHRGEGARRLAVCAVVDLAVALVGLFVVGMIVSPVLGI